MPTAHQRRLGLWLSIGAVTLLTLLWLFWPRAVAVDFARVAVGPLQVSVSDEGETRVRDVFVVSAPVPGLIDESRWRPAMPSSPAKPGRPHRTERAAFLDQRSEAEARAAVKTAEAAQKLALASQERAAAELDFAQAELRRFAVWPSTTRCRPTISMPPIGASAPRRRPSMRPARLCARANPNSPRRAPG